GSRNELKLNMQSFTFPLIEEKLALSLEGFISQFGGILGLYIGISFAGLVHIPIFAIRKGVEHFRCRSQARKRNTVHFGKALQEDVIIELSSSQCNTMKRTRIDVIQAFEELLERFDSMDKRFHVIEGRVELIEQKL